MLEVLANRRASAAESCTVVTQILDLLQRVGCGLEWEYCKRYTERLPQKRVDGVQRWINVVGNDGRSNTATQGPAHDDLRRKSVSFPTPRIYRILLPDGHVPQSSLRRQRQTSMI